MSLSSWHDDICHICSVPIDCEREHLDIRAVPTNQGRGILFLPPQFKKRPSRLQWPNFRSICQVHQAGSLPNALLVHYHCVLILCWVRKDVPILALTSALPQICQPCIEPPPSRLEFDIYRMFDHIRDPLVQRLANIPAEIFNTIITYLAPDQALAVASTRDALLLNPRRLISPYRSNVGDILQSYFSRRRLAHLYHVAFYLSGERVRIGPRTRKVSLGPHTTAIVITINGKRYLHEFCDEGLLAPEGQSGFSIIRMRLKNPTHVALVVDEFGIIDFAFEQVNGFLRWMLGIDPTTQKIFVEKAPTGRLDNVQVTYDVSNVLRPYTNMILIVVVH